MTLLVAALVVCPSQVTTGRAVVAAGESRSERTGDWYSSSGYAPLGAQVSSPPILSAQVPAGTKFEVASVRRNTTGAGRTLMDGTGGRFTVTNATLRQLILIAYELQDSQLVGPGWIDSARYDIQASRGGAPFDAVPAMLQVLLAERFGFKGHVEPHDMPRYTLVTARGDARFGPQMKLAICEGRKVPSAVAFPTPGDVMLCGTQFMTAQPGGANNLRVSGQPMKVFAQLLTRFAGRIVIDKTGLSGVYDIDLTWTADTPPTPDAVAVQDAGTSLVTALQDQLGLRLTGDRGPVDVLHVDLVTEATEN